MRINLTINRINKVNLWSNIQEWHILYKPLLNFPKFPRSSVIFTRGPNSVMHRYCSERHFRHKFLLQYVSKKSQKSGQYWALCNLSVQASAEISSTSLKTYCVAVKRTNYVCNCFFLRQDATGVTVSAFISD